MKISFEIEEIELMKVAINKRLKEMKSHPQEKSNLEQNLRLHELLDKIYRQEIRLSISDRSLLKGVVNELIYKPEQERINYFRSISNLDFLTLTEKEKKEIEHLDKIIAITNKFVPHKNRKRLFKETIDIINAIKNSHSDKYYFSTCENKIYKIGIPINEEQMIAIELESEDEIERFNYVDIKRFKPQTTYEKTGTKKEIIALFKNYEKGNRLTYRQKFLKEILRQNNS